MTISQLIMKKTRPLFVLLLITTLFLPACEDSGGFSIVRNNDYVSHSNDTEIPDPNEPVSHTGSSGGVGTDNVDVDHTHEPTPVEPGDNNGNIFTPGSTSGNKITNFKVKCLKIDDEGYINVTFDSDPFMDNMDFSYYTINDIKLQHSDFNEMEIVDEKETHKLYLGAKDNGTYIIKFYDSSSIQYGRADINVNFKDYNVSKVYVAVAFNLIQVRWVAIKEKIEEGFRKIGDFFNNLFSEDKIAI